MIDREESRLEAIPDLGNGSTEELASLTAEYRNYAEF
jgi:hypothetical protein